MTTLVRYSSELAPFQLLHLSSLSKPQMTACDYVSATEDSFNLPLKASTFTHHSRKINAVKILQVLSYHIYGRNIQFGTYCQG